MDLLQQASAAYSRSDLPSLNKIAGQLDVATGGDKYAVLSALVNKVNTEVSNVTAGGFAPHAEDVAQMMKNMTPNNTNDQINALVKTYTGLMAGRLEPVNNEIKQLTGEDLKVIDPNVSKLFQRYGYQTPWDHTSNQNNNQNNNNQNANQNGPQSNFTYTTSDGKMGWNGSTWVPTGK
jgi:hypothetical protein